MHLLLLFSIIHILVIDLKTPLLAHPYQIGCFLVDVIEHDLMKGLDSTAIFGAFAGWLLRRSTAIAATAACLFLLRRACCVVIGGSVIVIIRCC